MGREHSRLTSRSFLPRFHGLMPWSACDNDMAQSRPLVPVPRSHRGQGGTYGSGDQAGELVRESQRGQVFEAVLKFWVDAVG